jgi:hypothetical protein
MLSELNAVGQLLAVPPHVGLLSQIKSLSIGRGVPQTLICDLSD